MKLELLRNCVHGSEIATYLATDEFGERRVAKTSTTLSGIKNLLNEVEGWRWYQELRHQSNDPICWIAQQKVKYLQIYIKYIDGYTPVYQNGLMRNADSIRKIVQHYCQTWPRSSDWTPMHGDLSLDNVIINGDDVHIIDWEHFTAASAPWGFDIMYLLFVSLYFGMYSGKHQRHKPTRQETQIICEHINTIINHHQLHSEMLKAPLRFIREYISAHHDSWGAQLSSFPMKLPIIAFSSEQVTMIDEMIMAGLAQTHLLRSQHYQEAP
jgi:hypothetical protein